jgi:hypothetical protein
MMLTWKARYPSRRLCGRYPGRVSNYLESLRWVVTVGQISKRGATYAKRYCVLIRYLLPKRCDLLVLG